MEALDAVITRVTEVAAAGRLPVVVLDLDSTVIDTGWRHLRIVREFAAELGDTGFSAMAGALTADDFGFLVQDPLLARGMHDPELIEALRRFWWPRFFSADYCRHDRAAPGAVAFARRVVGARGLVYYLTARPVDMGAGTVEVLVGQGFPFLRGRAVLHMKPSADLDDHRFKRAALAEVRSLRGEVVATFENEPAHAGALLEAFPEGTHFLVGDVRSPGAPEPHPALVPLPSFLG